MFIVRAGSGEPLVVLLRLLRDIPWCTSLPLLLFALLSHHQWHQCMIITSSYLRHVLGLSHFAGSHWSWLDLLQWCCPSSPTAIVIIKVVKGREVKVLAVQTCCHVLCLLSVINFWALITLSGTERPLWRCHASCGNNFWIAFILLKIKTIADQTRQVRINETK